MFVESKAVESGETSEQPSYLMRTSAAGLNVIRYLQESSLSELALRYLVEVSIKKQISLNSSHPFN